MILPNQLTVLRIILTPIFLFLFIQDDPVMKQISAVIFIIAAFTDWYDGWLARKINYITKWGKFLDPLADKILTLTAFFALVYLDKLELWMVIVIASRDITITFVRIIADLKNISFKTSLSAKWKTFIQMAFLYYLLTFYTLETFPYLAENYPGFFSIVLHPDLIYFIMFFITILTAYTGITYFFKNRALFKGLFKVEK